MPKKQTVDNHFLAERQLFTSRNALLSKAIIPQGHGANSIPESPGFIMTGPHPNQLA
jgi:hypothetical protein